MWVLAIKPTLPEREKFSKLLNSPASHLLILIFWHLQLTLKSKLLGREEAAGGCQAGAGRGAVDGDPCSGGPRKRCAPALLTLG